MSCVFLVGIGTVLHVLRLVPIISHSHLMGSVLLIWFYDTKRLTSLGYRLSHQNIYSTKHIYKGVLLFEPVAGHLSGKVVGPSVVASIVRETMN